MKKGRWILELLFNGRILTMEGGVRASAILTHEGRILAVGESEALAGKAGADCRRTDLRGAAVLPGFIDGHSHLVQFANSLRFVSLAGCTSFSQIQEALAQRLMPGKPSAEDWIVGFGYDHNRLDEAGHPDRFTLDEVSSVRPILISHASGHMGCANSAALSAAGIGPGTPDPDGGRIGRHHDGTPSGYLEENAFMALAAVVPQPSREQMLRHLDEAQKRYLSYGVTTAQEGLMKQPEFELLDDAAERGRLKLDVVGYADIRDSASLLRQHPDRFSYRARFRLGGYKLFLDGSPQGRTAWLTAPYLPSGDQDETYCGYPIYTDEQVRAFVAAAASEGRQLLTHCNGDAAIDQLLSAYEAPSLHRDVVIHAQLMRRGQLPRLRELGLMPSYFVAHTWYWGDTHLRNLGTDRAKRISPLASTAALGIPFTLHQDTPVLPPDMLQTVWCAARRITSGGVLLADDERISPEAALQAITLWGARQYSEEDTKGSLVPGKRADLVILDRDPTAVPTDEIPAISILATVKDGEAVYRRPPHPAN